VSSSISNSRKIYLKILLVVVIGSGLSMGLVRYFSYLNDASSETILGRVMEAKQALPLIVKEPHDLVMFFGSSMTEAGFSPRLFDYELNKQGINIKSFNFGFGGLNPYFQNIFSVRIKEQFQQNNKRLKLALLEFNPFQTTVTREQGAVSLEDSFLSWLASDEEIKQITLKDPTRGLRLYNIKYLRDGISAEMVTNFFGRSFSIPRKRTEIPRDDELEKRIDEVGILLNEAFTNEYPDYKPSQWSYEWQGGGTIPEERSKKTLEITEEFYQLQNLNNRDLDDDRLHRIASADIIDLHFSDRLVDSYIELIKNFQQFSDQVEVIMLPRNTAWINNSAAGIQRLNTTLKKIEQATGVRIKNHQDLDVMKPSMFSDTTHLNRYQGQVAYTNHLINQYKDNLK
jgi:hypothetical protein